MGVGGGTGVGGAVVGVGRETNGVGVGDGVSVGDGAGVRLGVGVAGKVVGVSAGVLGVGDGVGIGVLVGSSPMGTITTSSWTIPSYPAPSGPLIKTVTACGPTPFAGLISQIQVAVKLTCLVTQSVSR